MKLAIAEITYDDADGVSYIFEWFKAPLPKALEEKGIWYIEIESLEELQQVLDIPTIIGIHKLHVRDEECLVLVAY